MSTTNDSKWPQWRRSLFGNNIRSVSERLFENNAQLEFLFAWFLFYCQ
jgi:hypothetical protein